MKWVPDRTGRFPQRPHFEPQELDYECEDVVSAFLKDKHGSANYPISTNDLFILLDQKTSDLDVYADLSEEGDDVEGLTEFVSRGKPMVKIARTLSEDPRRENRYRTTMTHEFGHVKFHVPLFAVMAQQAKLFKDVADGLSPRCKRESVLNAAPVDWMEWQAGYISGAILMPLTPLKRIVGDVLAVRRDFGKVAADSPAGRDLILKVQAAFQVSADAAGVRLSKLGYLGDGVTSPPLFRS